MDTARSVAIPFLMAPRSAYAAERATALSGVPKSTVQYWAGPPILLPSVSAERVKLWSYGDPMALRTIYQQRQTKHEERARGLQARGPSTASYCRRQRQESTERGSIPPREIYEQAAREADADSLGRLAEADYGIYPRL